MTDPLTVACPTCDAARCDKCRDVRAHPATATPRVLKRPHVARVRLANRDKIREPGRFIGVREAALRLSLHENTIRNMIADGRLTDARIPGAPFAKLDAQQIDALAEGRVKFT